MFRNKWNKFRPAGWTAVLLLPLVLGGCTFAQKTKYDERYRMFFSRDLPVNTDASASVDELAGRFVPEIVVRRSVEDFTSQDFELDRIEPIEWGEGACLFVFRRKLGLGEEPLRAPLSFTGAYRVESGDGAPTDYILTQGEDNYTIHIMSGSEITTYLAEWEGRELVWWTDEGKNNARLTPDGSVLYHLIENPTGFDLPRERKITMAKRLVQRQEPLEQDIREARRYTIRLKPQTPRYYDPYPW